MTSITEHQQAAPRATIDDSGRLIYVIVDGCIVGQGTKGKRGMAESQALADELNASDEKCDRLKQILGV